MYSNSSVAVDKGLGFDFSDIANLVKTALPVGLNIFQQQQQIKAIKSGVPGLNLPLAQMYGMTAQPNIPGQYIPQSSGISTTTVLMIGGALVVGLLAFKFLK